MSASSELSAEAERYLRRLSTALRSMDPPEREAIIQETRSHLVERAAEGPGSVADTLRAFGRPESYAVHFLEDADLRSALARNAALPMLGEVLRLAGKSLAAFLAATVILLLCTFALSFGVLAVVKPIAPEAVGLWIDSAGGSFAFGIVSESSRQGAAEVLGYWIIPIALVGLVLSLVAATGLQRMVIARRLRRVESARTGQGP